MKLQLSIYFCFVFTCSIFAQKKITISAYTNFTNGNIYSYRLNDNDISLKEKIIYWVPGVQLSGGMEVSIYTNWLVRLSYWDRNPAAGFKVKKYTFGASGTLCWKDQMYLLETGYKWSIFKNDEEQAFVQRIGLKGLLGFGYFKMGEICPNSDGFSGISSGDGQRINDNVVVSILDRSTYLFSGRLECFFDLNYRITPFFFFQIERGFKNEIGEVRYDYTVTDIATGTFIDSGSGRTWADGSGRYRGIGIMFRLIE